MSANLDIEKFVKKPSLLVDLCRQVIDEIDARSNDPETDEMGTQLREIARTIDRIDKAGVPIPEALRAEKTRLVAALGSKTEILQVLSLLTDNLEDLLRDLKKRLGRDKSHAAIKKRRDRSSHLPRTSMRFYREYIIHALKKLGGSAQTMDIFKEMEVQLSGKLLPGDMESDSKGRIIWHIYAGWERFYMVKEGILRSDSLRGYWELSEARQ